METLIQFFELEFLFSKEVVFFYRYKIRKQKTKDKDLLEEIESTGAKNRK